MATGLAKEGIFSNTLFFYSKFEDFPYSEILAFTTRAVILLLAIFSSFMITNGLKTRNHV